MIRLPMPDTTIDPLFQKHLDIMSALHEDLKADIENAWGEVSLDEVLQNPEAELSILSEQIAVAMFKKFETKFIAEGVRFADEIKNTSRKIGETVISSTVDK